MPERNQLEFFFSLSLLQLVIQSFYDVLQSFDKSWWCRKRKKTFWKWTGFAQNEKKTFVGQNFAKINKWHWSSFFSGTQSRGAFWNDNQMLFKLERFCHRVCLFKPVIVPAALLKGLLLFLSKSAKKFWQLLYFSSTTFYPRSDKHYGRGGLDPGSSCSTSNSSSH